MLAKQRSEKLWALLLPAAVFIVFAARPLAALHDQFHQSYHPHLFSDDGRSLYIIIRARRSLAGAISERSGARAWIFDIGPHRCPIGLSHGSGEVAGKHRGALHTHASRHANSTADTAYHDGTWAGFSFAGNDRSDVYVHLHHHKHTRGSAKYRQITNRDGSVVRRQ